MAGKGKTGEGNEDRRRRPRRGAWEVAGRADEVKFVGPVRGKGSPAVGEEIPDIVSVEDRTRWIADRMAEDRWPNFPYALEYRTMLARRWNVTEAAIRNYSAEAHRMVGVTDADRPRLQAEIARRLLAIADDAYARQNMVTGMPDYESSRKALLDYGKYSGIELAAEKVRVSVDPVKLTDEELIQLGREALAALQAGAGAGPGRGGQR